MKYNGLEAGLFQKNSNFCTVVFGISLFLASLAIMSTVSENIRYLRKLKGYTQEQFAERIGIKRSLLGAYEEARANPNEIYLDSMAEVLGVSVENLLKDNLKEHVRRLGTGNILKLNPDRIEPAASSGGSDEEEAANETFLQAKTERREDAPAKGAQMGLFTDSLAEGGSSSKKIAADSSDLVGLLKSLIETQKGLKLFSDLEDMPLRGVHFIGTSLERANLIENNTLYIVKTVEGQVLFRRVFNQIAIKGTLILSSDFPDKPTLELPESSISEVYRYVATVQTEAPSAVVPARRLKELTNEMVRLLNNT